MTGVDAFRLSPVRQWAGQTVTAAKAVRAGRARRRTTPRPDPHVDGSALRDLLASTGADATLVHVTINRPQWTTTGVRASVGDRITWLAWGYAYVIKPLAVGVSPRFALGGRAGTGAVHQSGRDTFTFTADEAGEVALASLFPGELRADGSIATDRVPFRFMTGGFDAVVVRWPPGVDPRAVVGTVADRDASGLCAAEVKRLDDAPGPPPGWTYHPLLRPGETYSRGERGIATRVEGAVGIIRRPVDVELTAETRLRWSWRIDALPSRLAENTTLTHDYLSVAVEFDDGRDLTWHWSRALPPGYSYPCPFDHWRRRETHVVVRTGTADLGRWVVEERPVLADHRAAIGGRTPRRVVAVWLISCSFLQGHEGRGEVSSMALTDGDDTIAVL